jgi:arylsulfatase A-like enzyme
MPGFSRLRWILLAFLLLTLPAYSNPVQPPNFLVLLVDDQSWSGTPVAMVPGNDLSRSKDLRMPNLERLAAKGMVFSQAYAAHPKCECSRAALLMGRSTTSLNAVVKHAATWNAPPADSLANTLKRANPAYRAAHFGKWQWPTPPDQFGYDAHDGITQNEDGDSTDPMDPKLSFSLTRRAQAYMQRQTRDRHPFYLQLSYYAVHQQPQALAATLQKYQDGASQKGKPGKGGPVFSAMAEDLDTCIGSLFRTLESLGVTQNTYIIYTSDNGGRSPALKGGKTLCDEGGIRVPLIVAGPGIKPGTVSSVPVISYDIFPTVLDLVNPTFALPKGIEGGTWKPVLTHTGQGTVNRPISRMVWHHDVEIEHPQTALRKGDFKLLHYWDTHESFLYDVVRDLGEEHNLARERPEIAAQLLEELRAHVRSGLGESRFSELERGIAGDSNRPKGNKGPGKGKKGRPGPA